MKPKLLDLFCGGGGAALGYAEAGFDVIGVDHIDQPEYPYEFVQADAIEFATKFARDFDAIHASPPCQSQTALTKGTNAGREYPNLIPQTRDALSVVDVPTVIENVSGIEVRPDLMLCGEMFDLDVLRHRYFEVENFFVPRLMHPIHRGRVRGWRHGVYYDGPYLAVYGEGGGKGTVDEWRSAMRIEHITDRKTLAEAIPPAYTRFIGTHMLYFV